MEKIQKYEDFGLTSKQLIALLQAAWARDEKLLETLIDVFLAKN